MEFLTQNIYWFVLAAVSGGMLIWPMVRGNGRYGVSPVQAVQLINRQDAIIVDVRSREEFEAGHLPAARHIPAAEIEQKSGDLSKFKNRPVVVVCQSGARGEAAVSTLRKAGFEQAFNLDGGVAEWQKAGQLLVKGS